MDYLDGSRRIHLTDEPEAAMAQAAAWAGHFHAEQEISPRRPGPRGFNRYDRAYYAGWARRARLFSAPVRELFPWFESLCERFDGMIDELSDAPQTLVHGEFYPKNILLYRGDIYPVDWESAAIAPGEIDLATVTEGWTRRATQRCESQYAAARWPDGAPESFARRLALCRLYVHLRWLGDRPEWTLRNSSCWHFKQLHKAAKQLGALP
jgi:aminoglycoside phosphotransferase (APT) family kinase protein